MRILILFSILFSQAVFGQTIFEPFREGTSNYVSEKQAEKARRLFNGIDQTLIQSLSNELIGISQNSEATYEDVTKAFQRSFNSISQHKFELSNEYQNVLRLLRSRDLIDDILYRLLTEHFNQYFYYERNDEIGQQFKPEGAGILLKDYVAKKTALKKLYSKMTKYPDDEVSSSQLNPFPLKQFSMKAGQYSGLSARERIFYQYTPAQIREMALLIDVALSIADAKSVSTTVEFRNGSAPMVINHSPTDQYRLALRIMRMQKLEAENDKSRLGTYVSDLDLIAAAYEVGIVSYDEVSLVANNKDFYVPEISFAKKVFTYMSNLAGIAIRVYPLTAPYAIIPIMIYNSYAEVKKAQSKIDEDSFIFSLPKRN